MPAWSEPARCKRTKCLRLSVISVRASVAANAKMFSSDTACPARPLSWLVSTSCPSCRSSSTAGRGNFSLAYNRAIMLPHSQQSAAQSLPGASGNKPKRSPSLLPVSWDNYVIYLLHSLQGVWRVPKPTQGYACAQRTVLPRKPQACSRRQGKHRPNHALSIVTPVLFQRVSSWREVVQSLPEPS